METVSSEGELSDYHNLAVRYAFVKLRNILLIIAQPQFK